MNHYGAQAMRHWRTHLPTRFAQITEYAAEATTAVRAAAIAALGPANPLAQLLERQQRSRS